MVQVKAITKHWLWGDVLAPKDVELAMAQLTAQAGTAMEQVRKNLKKAGWCTAFAAAAALVAFGSKYANEQIGEAHQHDADARSRANAYCSTEVMKEFVAPRLAVASTTKADLNAVAKVFHAQAKIHIEECMPSRAHYEAQKGSLMWVTGISAGAAGGLAVYVLLSPLWAAAGAGVTVARRRHLAKQLDGANDEIHAHMHAEGTPPGAAANKTQPSPT